MSELCVDSDVWALMQWPSRKPSPTELYWIGRSSLFGLLSTRRQAQMRPMRRIPRGSSPPALDPQDPAGLLWDWAPDEGDEWRS